MQIDLSNVFNNDGEIIEINHAADFSGFELNGGHPIINPVQITGKIENRAGIVTITAIAEFDFSAPCDRCAAQTDKHFKINIDHLLVSELNDDENDRLMLVDGMVLDLDELVTTDIVLELPSKYLCSEHCKGLCMQCGKNLNEGLCGCKKAVDPRLAALQQLLDED